MKGGHGRGITARGRAVGVRGNISRVGVPVVAQRATVGPQAAGVRGAGAGGQTRLNVRGTQRGKPQPNLPGEIVQRNGWERSSCLLYCFFDFW